MYPPGQVPHGPPGGRLPGNHHRPQGPAVCHQCRQRQTFLRETGDEQQNTADGAGEGEDDESERLELLSLVNLIVELDGQIWVQSGSNWPQMGQIRDFFSIRLQYILALRAKMY